MAKRDTTESSAAPRRRRKRHAWQWDGSLHTKRLSTVSSLYVHTHTHNTHVIICTHLFFIEHPTPNTQKKKGKTFCVTLHFINRARARVQNRGSHTGSTRRRRFLRRVSRGRSRFVLFVVVVVVGCKRWEPVRSHGLVSVPSDECIRATRPRYLRCVVLEIPFYSAHGL